MASCPACTGCLVEMRRSGSSVAASKISRASQLICADPPALKTASLMKRATPPLLSAWTRSFTPSFSRSISHV